MKTLCQTFIVIYFLPRDALSSCPFPCLVSLAVHTSAIDGSGTLRLGLPWVLFHGVMCPWESPSRGDLGPHLQGRAIQTKHYCWELFCQPSKFALSLG